MEKKTDMNQKARSGKSKNNSSPLNGRSALFSSDYTGTIGTKRQTYHIHVDLIAKLQGYAYWEKRMISEVVNCASWNNFLRIKKLSRVHRKRTYPRKKGDLECICAGIDLSFSKIKCSDRVPHIERRGKDGKFITHSVDWR